LNQHDDAIGDDRLPTWAFVVSLTKGQWKEGFGGELEYLTARAGTTQTWSEHHLIPGTQRIAAPHSFVRLFLYTSFVFFLSRV
jgi:Rps23 Pro-64 3,4-dihydroxylase Tpa1-like proline 4-hydroxylase